MPSRSAATCTPAVSVGVTSSGLRSASEIFPSDEASATRSASLGETASVTTVEGCALPSFACSWSNLVPAVRTSTLLATVRDIDSSAWPLPRSVTTRSTRVPGTTKPATPITSSTFTDMARMPGGIDGGKPAPDPSGASLVSVNGSFSPTAATRPRSRIGLTSENAPGHRVPGWPRNELHVCFRDPRSGWQVASGDRNERVRHFDLADRDALDCRINAKAGDACHEGCDGHNNHRSCSAIHAVS